MKSFRLLVVAVVLGTGLVGQARAEEPAGRQVYTESCVRCHGKDGQGTKKSKKPLTGTLSVAQLADLIQRTMPEDDPGSLSVEAARQAAEYVHATFYSPAAQERNRPARVELARLTVDQYRHTLADLIGSFNGGGNVSWWDAKRGLKAEYFKKTSYQDRAVERIDETINFDFGLKAPAVGKGLPDNEFSIRWTGSLLAPETGEYKFVVKASHAMVFFLNTDWRKPTLDARVQSGNDKEYRTSMYLIGGRTYPIQIEFAKGLVANSKGDKAKPAQAFIHFSWQPPHGSLTPVPATQLSPQWSPIGYVCDTPFPADDRSRGWERGTTVSKAWDQATTESAIEAANFVTAKFTELADIKDKDTEQQRTDKTIKFLRAFVKKAFRKPVTDDVEALYITRSLEATKPNLVAGVKRAVLVTLKSPRFLYREVNGEPNQYDVAARLAFSLTDSLPDNELATAAAAGKLKTADDLRPHAWRLIGDTRTQANLRQFLHHWLRTDHGRDATKDAKRFPGFDATVIADLRASLELGMTEVLQSEKADLKQLLTGDEIYLNGRLAKYYGADLPADAPFQKVKFEADKRAGVLTHPFLLATFAYSAETSPIHRGVFLAKGILGTGLKPPQDAFSPLTADAHPTLSTRERVVLQTQGANCQTCHNIINGLGFTLENFDAVGKYRDKDNNKPVDPTGKYLTRSGETKTFTAPRELAKFLADSDEVATAFTEQLFHHLIQQPVRAYGPNTLTELTTWFKNSGHNIRGLAVEIATRGALTTAPKPATTTAQK